MKDLELFRKGKHKNLIASQVSIKNCEDSLAKRPSKTRTNKAIKKPRAKRTKPKDKPTIKKQKGASKIVRGGYVIRANLWEGTAVRSTDLDVFWGDSTVTVVIIAVIGENCIVSTNVRLRS